MLGEIVHSVCCMLSAAIFFCLLASARSPGGVPDRCWLDVGGTGQLGAWVELNEHITGGNPMYRKSKHTSRIQAFKRVGVWMNGEGKELEFRSDDTRRGQTDGRCVNNRCGLWFINIFSTTFPQLGVTYHTAQWMIRRLLLSSRLPFVRPSWEPAHGPSSSTGPLLKSALRPSTVGHNLCLSSCGDGGTGKLEMRTPRYQVWLNCLDRNLMYMDSNGCRHISSNVIMFGGVGRLGCKASNSCPLGVESTSIVRRHSRGSSAYNMRSSNTHGEAHDAEDVEYRTLPHKAFRPSAEVSGCSKQKKAGFGKLGYRPFQHTVATDDKRWIEHRQIAMQRAGKGGKEFVHDGASMRGADRRDTAGNASGTKRRRLSTGSGHDRSRRGGRRQEHNDVTGKIWGGDRRRENMRAHNVIRGRRRPVFPDVCGGNTTNVDVVAKIYKGKNGMKHEEAAHRHRVTQTNYQSAKNSSEGDPGETEVSLNFVGTAEGSSNRRWTEALFEDKEDELTSHDRPTDSSWRDTVSLDNDIHDEERDTAGGRGVESMTDCAFAEVQRGEALAAREVVGNSGGCVGGCYEDERYLKPNFLDESRSSLEEKMKSWGVCRYRADQLWKWVYDGPVEDVSKMRNIPSAVRTMVDSWYSIGHLIPTQQLASSIDGTVKTTYRLPPSSPIITLKPPPSGAEMDVVACRQQDGSVFAGSPSETDARGHARPAVIESVLMKYKDGRRTACVSSQAGCAMGCVFCATGRMGFVKQLTSSQIFEQAYKMATLCQAQESERLSNVVFMGMGEPLANYDNVLEAVGRINRLPLSVVPSVHVSVCSLCLRNPTR
eukprot:GHVQ01023597.1.p1 GENE.GHVQ01023597.1~~GHVQ01023597.1.p1  ORF type:complete len:824 (+),score=120.32 GHVQ01023597.1:230-2701(+)